MSTSSSRLIRQSILIFTALILVIIAPIYLLLSLPIFAFRYLIQKLAEVARPDLVEMLASGSSLFAQNDSLDDPKSSIVSQFTFEGQFEAEEFITAFQSRVIDFQAEDGQYPYAKFHQYITDWSGFKFWKEEDKFNIRNHIKIHPELTDKTVTEEDLTKLSAVAISQPYEKTRSPWEIFIIPSVSVEADPGNLRTAAIFRLSHALGDGFSLIKMTSKLFATVKPCPSIIPDIPMTKSSFLDRLLFVPNCFYKLSEILLLSIQSPLWKVPPSQQTGRCNVVSARVMECNVVKQAKNQHNVAFTSVVYSALAAAIRNLSLKKGIKISDGETMPLLIPIPKPRHPGGLVNHFTLTLLDLPVGEADTVQRLLTCNATYDKLKTSVTPFVTGIIATAFGSYFTLIGKHLKNTFSGSLVSYLPTGFDNEDFSLNGRQMTSTCFYLGLQQGCSAISISLCSLGEDIRATVVADEGVFSMDEISLLLSMISDETELLANCGKEKTDLCGTKHAKCMEALNKK